MHWFEILWTVWTVGGIALSIVGAILYYIYSEKDAEDAMNRAGAIFMLGFFATFFYLLIPVLIIGAIPFIVLFFIMNFVGGQLSKIREKVQRNKHDKNQKEESTLSKI